MPKLVGALILVLAIALPAAAAERRILLHTSFANANEKKERKPKPKRSRFIEPDFAALDAPSLKKNEWKKVERKLTAALFDDTVLHLELDAVERNAVDAYVWSGRVEGDDASSVTIVVKENAMTAAISTTTHRYMIEPAENGAHEALDLDLTAFPNELEPERPIVASAVRPDAIAVNDTAAFVDVLVVYTDDLRASLGGTSAAQTAASNAIGATNTAYQNSGVTMRLRLAGTLEVAYNDAGNLSEALYDVRDVDGMIDNVHTVRDQVGADAVAMLVLNSSSGCGIGFVMTGSPRANFAPNAFSVTAWSCAVGNLSFPHELGHNFGLEHDRFVSPSGNPAFPYGFGWVDTGNAFRDIMAYANACGGCTRMQYFSTPLLSYLGRPFGVSYESSPSTSADNVRALNGAALTIANFRQAVTYTAPTFTDDPAVGGTTPIRALHINELRTAINNYRAFANLSAYSWATTISTGGTVNASHVTELRTALTPALTALSRTATYTDSTLSSAIAIKAVHIQELRNYVK